MNLLSNRTSIKIPNVVHVIRKKNRLKPVETYWSNKEIDKDTYYSNILGNKLYLYAFLNDRSAQRCHSFLQKYNVIHGRYPSTNDGDTPSNFNENDERVFFIA